MIFNLFGKKRKERAALQKAAAQQKRTEAFKERRRQVDAFRKDRVFDNFEWHYVDEVQSLTYPTNRTFEVLADSKVIESDFFNIKEKRLVCFADQTGNTEFENYIAGNLDSITKHLAEKDWSFVHKPLKIEDVELFNLPYFFPFASWDNHLLSELKNLATQETMGNEILKFYKYNGPIKTGFIFITGNKFIIIAKKEEESIAEFVQQWLAYMPRRMPDVQYCFPPDDYSGIDQETAETISQIKLSLDKLKENGQFFAIAPTLLKMIEKASRDTPRISRMRVDHDHRILLPDYQNREIKLSHLTKSLYFLFLNHPKGVYARDFKLYENELLEIYKKISNRVDLDKMRESILELCNADGKALRTHISRIKSAFAKEFSDFYASKYYVIGGDVRIVLLDRQLLNWDAEL